MFFLEEFLGDLYAVASRTWEGTVLFAVWFLAASLTAVRLTGEGGRAGLRRALDAGSLSADADAGFPAVSRTGKDAATSVTLYQSWLGAALHWLAIKLPASPPAHAESWRTAWSATLYDRSLLFAVLYPVLSVVIFWAWTDLPGRIGNINVLEGGVEAWRRAATVFSLILAAIFFRLSTSLSIRNINVIKQYERSTRYLFLSIALFCAFIFTNNFAMEGTFQMMGAFVFAFSLSGILSRPGSGAVVFAIAIVFSGGGSSGAYAFLGVIVFFSITTYIFELVNTNMPRISLTYILVTTIPPSFLGFGVAAADYHEVPFLIFLGLLPLANAIFDFLSIGVTRYALKQGLMRGFGARAMISLADLLAALLCLAALVAALIAGAHLLNRVAPAPLIDLQDLFDGIWARPGDYWWLYATLFSTLLPTLLHLFLWMASLAVALPAPLRRAMLGWLDAHKADGDGKWLWCFGLVFPALIALGVGGAVILVGHAAMQIWGHFPLLGYFTLYAAESFAQWIGAAVDPAAIPVPASLEI